MKVILKQTVPGMGKKNEVVNVSDGHARNYLIPRGLAVEASSGPMKQLKNLQVAESKRDEKLRDQAEKTALKLQESTLVIRAKTGPDGKLYGSVTSADIASRLKDEFKIDVDRRRIGLPDPIKSLGLHVIPMGLLSTLTVNLNVEVISES